MIIAIDPGASGGIARVTKDGRVMSQKMPETLRDIWDQLHELIPTTQLDTPQVVYIEKVGTYMPGNSGPSAATFAMHVGALQMALIALKVRHLYVAPKVWMDAFIGKQSYPSIPKETPDKERKRILAVRKAERKTKIKTKAQQIFPNQTVTLATADALGILWYAMEAEQPKRIRPF